MGLLKTAAKAYVATRVIGSTHRRQQERWAAQDAQAAPPVPLPPAQVAPVVPLASPAPQPDATALLDQLTRLGQLRDAGVLTDLEFETQKQRILAAG